LEEASSGGFGLVDGHQVKPFLGNLVDSQVDFIVALIRPLFSAAEEVHDDKLVDVMDFEQAYWLNSDGDLSLSRKREASAYYSQT